MSIQDPDEQFMALAIEQARLAAEQGEVPVGAVVVKDGVVIGKGFNRPITAHDPCAHAEVIAIQAAALHEQNYRLPGCHLYVTLEPCTMCVGAIVHARIERLIYGATEPKAGVVKSHLELLQATHFNHLVTASSGVLAEESSQLLSDFFKQRRQHHKATKAAAKQAAAQESIH